jgi:hypothetical protein
MSNDDTMHSLIEMVCLRKRKTGLPVNIWAYDSDAWKEYGEDNCIKMQCDCSDCYNLKGLIRMSIDDNPRLLDVTLPMNLSITDVAEVQTFVARNKILLKQLGECEIDAEDFIKNMKRA